MKFIEGSVGDSKDFIRLKDKDVVQGVCAGEIYLFKQHWTGKNSEPCAEDPTCQLCLKGVKPQFKFRINFIVKEGTGYVAKIFEQGWTLYTALRELNSEYELEKHIVKISRRGSGVNDTEYSVVPVKDGALSTEKLEIISRVKLHDLTLKESGENAPEPKFDADQEIPF